MKYVGWFTWALLLACAAPFAGAAGLSDFADPTAAGPSAPWNDGGETPMGNKPLCNTLDCTRGVDDHNPWGAYLETTACLDQSQMAEPYQIYTMTRTKWNCPGNVFYYTCYDLELFIPTQCSAEIVEPECNEGDTCTPYYPGG